MAMLTEVKVLQVGQNILEKCKTGLYFSPTHLVGSFTAD